MFSFRGITVFKRLGKLRLDRGQLLDSVVCTHVLGR